MFSFAIYDINEGIIFIGRDRAGEKPLYYHKSNENFIFASELKSLLATGTINKQINNLALAQYFQLTYIPAPLTIFEDVYKLCAGCYMLINLSGDMTIKSYWDVNPDNNDLITDYNLCKKLLREALFTSVERRMISDVPVGAFLSGGIDSSIIVGIMSRLSDSPINTFTIGYKNKDYDESSRAEIAAKANNTNHHVYFLDFEEAFSHIDFIMNNMDEPFADSSAIPTFMVSKYASNFVKVVLTGDAGDELFGGYSKYLIGYYSNLYKRIPRPIREHLVERIVYSIPDTHSVTRKIRKVIENAGMDTFKQRINLMSLGFKSNELRLLIKRDTAFDSLALIEDYYRKFEGKTDELTQTLYTDFKVVLDGDMLVKVDRMSMLNSIETRAPLLSNDVINLAFKR
jgi:asparagine synthase (glutamine-hydrolysing)